MPGFFETTVGVFSSPAWIAFSIAATSRTLVDGTWLKTLRYQCTMGRWKALTKRGPNAAALEFVRWGIAQATIPTRSEDWPNLAHYCDLRMADSKLFDVYPPLLNERSEHNAQLAVKEVDLNLLTTGRNHAACFVSRRDSTDPPLF